MYAAVTLVEFDDRITGRRWSQIITAPRARVVRSLRDCYVDLDPGADELDPDDPEASEPDPTGYCLFVPPKGAIRVLIYPRRRPEGAELHISELDDSFPFVRFKE
jgi:hypothetical protein